MKELRRQIWNLEDRLRPVEDYINNSKEVSELVEYAVQKAMSQTRDDRRQRLTKGLVHCVAEGNSTSFDEKAETLDMLDALSEEDLAALRRVVTGGRQRFGNALPLTYPGSGAGIEPETEREMAAIVQKLSKLESRGLISETVMAPMNRFEAIGDSNHWINRWRGKTFEALPFGKKLIEIVDSPDRK